MDLEALAVVVSVIGGGDRGSYDQRAY